MFSFLFTLIIKNSCTTSLHVAPGNRKQKIYIYLLFSGKRSTDFSREKKKAEVIRRDPWCNRNNIIGKPNGSFYFSKSCFLLCIFLNLPQTGNERVHTVFRPVFFLFIFFSTEMLVTHNVTHGGSCVGSNRHTRAPRIVTD